MGGTDTMAMRATLLELKTYDDLAALPDDGNRHELIGGEIEVSPAPKIKHHDAQMAIYNTIHPFLVDRDAGRVFVAPCDVVLSEIDVVQPDLFVVVAERASIITEDNVRGVPDLIVEVLSPASRVRDLVRKAALYQRSGVAEYWIVDPDAATITVNVLVDGRYTPRLHEDGIARSTVLPGLAIDPVAVFSMPR